MVRLMRASIGMDAGHEMYSWRWPRWTMRWMHPCFLARDHVMGKVGCGWDLSSPAHLRAFCERWVVMLLALR